MNARRLTLGSTAVKTVAAAKTVTAAPQATLLTLVNQARAKRGADPIVEKTLVRYLNGYANGIPAQLIADLKSVI